jgi:hypothetical protein
VDVDEGGGGGGGRGGGDEGGAAGGGGHHQAGPGCVCVSDVGVLGWGGGVGIVGDDVTCG